MNWPAEGFVGAGPLSSKWACEVCGATGYPGGGWMGIHYRPHVPCPWCGRRFPVKLDGIGRVHTRCPKRPPESVVQHEYGSTTEDVSGAPETTRRTP